MTKLLYATLVPLHGMLGALGLALLVHPLVLRASKRAARVATAAALVILGQNVLGWLLYPSYRAAIKPRLLVEAPDAANHFETKEHLAWFCLVLAVGAALHLRVGGDVTLARIALALALLCGLVAAGLGVHVSAVDWLTSPG